MQLRKTWQRQHIIEVLNENGGGIEDESGLATAKLHKICGFDVSTTALVQTLIKMERLGIISRKIQGKRTYGIYIEEIPKNWCEQVIDIREFVGPDIETEPVNETDQELEELMLAVRPILESEINRRKTIGQELAQARARIAELLDDNNRLRLKLSPLQDEVKSLKSETAALRQRKNELQSKLDRIAERSRKEIEDEKAFRQVRSIMQSRPLAR